MPTKNVPSDKTLTKMQDWLNDHGHPSYQYLESLVEKGDPASFEKLRAIAQDLDLNYDPDITPQELIDAILKSVEDLPERFTS